MQEQAHISPPSDANDAKGAQRVFEEFFVLYQPALVSVERYLEQALECFSPNYAEAYRPWHQGLQDLFQGVYLVAKGIPLPDPERFRESLHMFSFDSAIQFLSDLCQSCRLALERDWAETFRDHINLLLFSLSILNRQQQHALAH